MRNIGWNVKQLDSNVITYVSAQPIPDNGVLDTPYALVTDTTIDCTPVKITTVIGSNIIDISANSKNRSFQSSHCLTSTCKAAINAVKQMIVSSEYPNMKFKTY